MPYRNEADVIKTYFEAHGWEAQKKAIPVHGIQPNGKQRCMDKRDLDICGPAYPGGIDGLVYHYKGSSYGYRKFQAADDLIRLGIVPAGHGDRRLGTLGCGVRRAWVDGLLPGIGNVTPEIIETTERILGLQSKTLPVDKRHGKGLIVNLQAGTTVRTNGEFYVVDLWEARQLGIPLDEAMGFVQMCGRLVLTEEHPTVFIVR